MGQRKGAASMLPSFAQTGRGGYKRESRSYPKPLNLTPLESEEVAHTQSGIWCPLLCLLKFCGWEGKQFVGLVNIFLLRKGTTVGKLCLLFIKSEIPKGKRPHLPSSLCMMPNTLWMVNKCHIIFTLHWLRMTFSQESCLLQQISQSVYISQEKDTV